MAKLEIDDDGHYYLNGKLVMWVNQKNELTLLKDIVDKPPKTPKDNKYYTYDETTDKVKNRGKKDISPDWYEDFSEA